MGKLSLQVSSNNLHDRCSLTGACISFLFRSGTTNVNQWPTNNIIYYELTAFYVLSNSIFVILMAIINMTGFMQWSAIQENVPCMIRIMSWTESILRPIQPYFSHIRTMIGKFDWFCEMKCRSGSERITRVFRSWERYFCVQETAHNQTQFFCESHETGIIFHLFSYLN